MIFGFLILCLAGHVISGPLDNDEVDCGFVRDESFPIGKFPWYASLYNSWFSGMHYKCGGSLIARDLILTSEACLQRHMDNGNPKNIIVMLGKSYFLNISGPVQIRGVKEKIIHPDYNYQRHHADLALLRLDEPVDYTDFVRPICVWTDGVENLPKVGLVPGFAYDDSYKGKALTSIRTVITNEHKCNFMHSRVSRIEYDSSLFCTTYEKAEVCVGDEGAGLYYEINGVWHVVGVNSVGIGWQREIVCNPFHYSGFTDIALYKNWIQKYLPRAMKIEGRNGALAVMSGWTIVILCSIFRTIF